MISDYETFYEILKQQIANALRDNPSVFDGRIDVMQVLSALEAVLEPMLKPGGGAA
jgi:hypothetical protein